VLRRHRLTFPIKKIIPFNNTNIITFLKANLFKDISEIMKNSTKKNHVFPLYFFLEAKMKYINQRLVSQAQGVAKKN